MFVVSGGRLGALPDWVASFHAARVAGVAPWVMAGFDYQPHEIPTCWTVWALMFERVDLEAKDQMRREAEAQRRKQLGT